MIQPLEALQVIEQTHIFVDHYKIGKINHFPELESRVNWPKFTKDLILKLNELNCDFYLKDSLKLYA